VSLGGKLEVRPTRPIRSIDDLATDAIQAAD
jgi:hypothetical protein